MSADASADALAIINISYIQGKLKTNFVNTDIRNCEISWS